MNDSHTHVVAVDGHFVVTGTATPYKEEEDGGHGEDDGDGEGQAQYVDPAEGGRVAVSAGMWVWIEWVWVCLVRLVWMFGVACLFSFLRRTPKRPTAAGVNMLFYHTIVFPKNKQTCGPRCGAGRRCGWGKSGSACPPWRTGACFGFVVWGDVGVGVLVLGCWGVGVGWV